MSDREALVDVAWNPARDPAWTPRRGLEDQARTLHHALEGYAPTPLHGAPTLAAELGLGAVLLKDESSRFGLPAFKALGRVVGDGLGGGRPPGRAGSRHPAPRVCATTRSARR